MIEYYVYEYFNIETNHVFYVGMGKDDRWKKIRGRNQYFLRYYEKYNCDVRKVAEHLTQEEAWEKEKELIAKYRAIGQCETNIANGGEGGIVLLGENNPMFGRPWWTEETPIEKIEEWKKSLARKGSDNGMYGISPKERMTEEKYAEWRNKQQTCHCGKNNGRAHSIIMYNVQTNDFKQFDTIMDCCWYMIDNHIATCKAETLRGIIREKIKTQQTYLGYYKFFNNMTTPCQA